MGPFVLRLDLADFLPDGLMFSCRVLCRVLVRRRGDSWSWRGWCHPQPAEVDTELAVFDDSTPPRHICAHTSHVRLVISWRTYAKKDKPLPSYERCRERWYH